MYNIRSMHTGRSAVVGVTCRCGSHCMVAWSHLWPGRWAGPARLAAGRAPSDSDSGCTPQTASGLWHTDRQTDTYVRTYTNRVSTILMYVHHHRYTHIQAMEQCTNSTHSCIRMSLYIRTYFPVHSSIPTVCSTYQHLQQKPSSFSSSWQAVCPLWSTPLALPQLLLSTAAPALTRGWEQLAVTYGTCEVWTQLSYYFLRRISISFSVSCSFRTLVLVLACPG